MNFKNVNFIDLTVLSSYLYVFLKVRKRQVLNYLLKIYYGNRMKSKKINELKFKIINDIIFICPMSHLSSTL